MKITADTNLLIRAETTSVKPRFAAKVLQEADLVAVPIPLLCELLSLLRGYVAERAIGHHVCEK
jgi:hypothetical protein